jgi:histidine triad (HIT) family protein
VAEDCIFCKIVEGKIPSKRVYEDKYVFAFHDIQPQAPVHVLVVPREHVKDVSGVSQEKLRVFQDVFFGAQKVAEKLSLEKDGFRTVFNTGRHACQSVFHLHLHVLGGKQLGGNMAG